LGFPNIIIRNKEKKSYYTCFDKYHYTLDSLPMAQIMALAICESLHKRIAYLKGQEIITLAKHAKTQDKSINTLINAAKRQTIPAFREKGIWKIATAY